MRNVKEAVLGMACLLLAIVVLVAGTILVLVALVGLCGYGTIQDFIHPGDEEEPDAPWES